MDRKRFRSSFLICLSFWLCLLTSTCIRLNNCQAAEADKEGGYGDPNEHSNHENENLGHAFLTEDSVVLITGAAGFLGSELALALHRTYSPRRIICVDRMIHPGSQEELALFEFQRQRSFNVMQTLGDKGRFYRVDFSPMIPEYFDLGEVPVLDHIFRENLDITHVVHLADPFPHSALQVVPREKEVPKAGMMEALMEQLAKHERERKYSENGDSDYIPPHFVYASSFEVYPHHNSNSNSNSNNNNNNNNNPHSKEEGKYTGSSSTSSYLLEETQTLSTPSSLRGASKVMDEMLAKLYYDTKNIYSVGLRFFTVYGPWGVPGSPLFEMAERAVTGDLDGIDEEYNQKEDRKRNSQYNNHDIWKESIHDFVYIDDAVDAMMAAMQFRTSELQPSPSTEGENNAKGRRNPHPIIFNVASGQGHSLDDILNTMQEFFPPISKKNASLSTERRTERIDVGSVGSTKRAGTLLGFKPQVNLREGIIKMLAWHYDRAFPYGGRGHTKDEGDNIKVHSEKEKKSIFFANQGIVGCLPYDKECLRGTPVFPCASECSHEAQCTKSYYDEVIGWTQALTSECATVLYTVDLDESLQSLPSADPKLQTSSKSFLKGTCNLAFVSQHSRLVQALQNPNRGSSFMGSSSSSGRRDDLFRNGSWVLIPLKVAPLGVDDSNDVIDKNEILKLLPKLSPGLFFGGTTKRAIYIDPDIMLDNIPKLLREASAQPYSEEMEGATAMLIGKGTPKDYFADDGDEEEEMMMMMDDPNHRQRGLESTNTLVQNAAYRMVRIAVSDNLFGDGFMELLDSRWIVHTLQSDDGRLFRCDVLGEIVQWEVTTDRSALEFVLGLHDMWSRVIAKASGVGPWWIGDNVKTVPEGHPTGRRRLLEEVEVDVVDRIGNDRARNTNIDADTGADIDADIGADTKSDKIDEVEHETGGDDEESEEDSEEEQNLVENSGEGEENERGEFVLDAVAQKEVAANEEKRGDSSDEQEDIRLVDSKQEGDNENEEESHNMERDLSSYDTWMGILSSSSVKYFVRIVPSSEVGVVSITGRS
jgi:nucleoside-diphosphate-sugar epimerase